MRDCVAPTRPLHIVSKLTMTHVKVSWQVVLITDLYIIPFTQVLNIMYISKP